MFIASGLVVAARLKEIHKPVDYAYQMIFAALIGGLIGARLWYVADHRDDLSDDFLGTLFGGSGLTWYGGAIGGAISVCIWARRKDMLNLGLLDLCAPALALGYAVGRVGCQVSGDGDYGKPWDGPWAMAYPDGVVPTDAGSTRRRSTSRWGWGSRPGPVAPARPLRTRAPVRALPVLAGLERFLVEFLRRNERRAPRSHDGPARLGGDGRRRRRLVCANGRSDGRARFLGCVTTDQAAGALIGGVWPREPSPGG